MGAIPEILTICIRFFCWTVHLRRCFSGQLDRQWCFWLVKVGVQLLLLLEVTVLHGRRCSIRGKLPLVGV